MITIKKEQVGTETEMGPDYPKKGKPIMGVTIKAKFGSLEYQVSRTNADLDINKLLDSRMKSEKNHFKWLLSELKQAKKNVAYLENIVETYQRDLPIMEKEIKAYKSKNKGVTL